MGSLCSYKRDDQNRSRILGDFGRQCCEWGIIRKRAGKLLVRGGHEVLIFDTCAGKYPEEMQLHTC